MKTRSAVAFDAGKAIEIANYNFAGPQAGEILIRNDATAISIADAFALCGDFPKVLFLSAPLANINKAHNLMHASKSIRAAIHF